MSKRTDFTCDEIRKYFNVSCETCGCNALPPFFSSAEFILIVIAAVVALLGAVFVGVCLCRRNRATAGKPVTIASDSMTEDLLANHDDDIIPSANTERPVTNNMQGVTTANGGEFATVRYNFTADSSYEEQISVNKDDRVQVLEKFDDGWWNIRHEESGRVGIVPASYCAVDS